MRDAVSFLWASWGMFYHAFSISILRKQQVIKTIDTGRTQEKESKALQLSTIS